MNPERSFDFLVHEVARLFTRRFNERALHALGLTRAQCRLLRYLAGHEGINQAGLADLLEIKPMTLVRQIDRMAEDGWVERRPDPSDRRARLLVLTDKARPVAAAIRGVAHEVRGEAFAGFATGEGEELIELLRRVHANLAAPTPVPGVEEGSDRPAAPWRAAEPRLADLVSAGGRP
jgi:MarR family transcriptional regulator, transcriptional regulator for hemolysin